MNFNQRKLCYLLISMNLAIDTMVFTTSYLYLTKELSLTDAQAVLLTTPLFVASLLAEIPTGIVADHFGYKKSFAASILLYIAANFITFSTGNYPLLVAANIVLGIGMAFRSGAFDALCIENFKDSVKEYYANIGIKESWLFSCAILFVVTFMLFRQRRYLD